MGWDMTLSHSMVQEMQSLSRLKLQMLEELLHFLLVRMSLLLPKKKVPRIGYIEYLISVTSHEYL